MGKKMGRGRDPSRCTGSGSRLAHQRQQAVTWPKLERAASLADGLGLKTQPSPLELAEDGVGEGVAALVTMSPRQLHNVLFDGFYAPYMTNPDYLLLIDARPSRASYGRRRLLTARHHTDVDLDAVGLARYVHLVVYDQDGAGVDRSDSTLAAVVRHLQRRRPEPCALLGGDWVVPEPNLT